MYMAGRYGKVICNKGPLLKAIKVRLKITIAPYRRKLEPIKGVCIK